ncbi:MAG: ELM1/GtrOC1 family putative glycosyltransferase, partial [Geminicoccales bacterium]
MSRPSPRVWVLTDARPGNDNQALGVALALGWPFTVVQLRYGPLARLPNLLLGSSTLGLTAAARAALMAPWPDLVIAAGRR